MGNHSSVGGRGLLGAARGCHLPVTVDSRVIRCMRTFSGGHAEDFRGAVKGLGEHR